MSETKVFQMWSTKIKITWFNKTKKFGEGIITSGHREGETVHVLESSFEDQTIQKKIKTGYVIDSLLNENKDGL